MRITDLAAAAVLVFGGSLVLSGLVPALRVSQVDLAQAFRDASAAPVTKDDASICRRDNMWLLLP